MWNSIVSVPDHCLFLSALPDMMDLTHKKQLLNLFCIVYIRLNETRIVQPNNCLRPVLLDIGVVIHFIMQSLHEKGNRNLTC